MAAQIVETFIVTIAQEGMFWLGSISDKAFRILLATRCLKFDLVPLLTAPPTVL